MSLQVNIITSFPEIFPGPLGYSLCGKALEKNIWSLKIINLRDYGLGKHKKIDDTMYGGGSGLILRPDVLERAIEENGLHKDLIYYPSPRGKVFSQNYAEKIAQHDKLNIICGRFEGLDQRIIQHYNVQELSLGDYILSNGELASFVILDAVIRIIPGVVSNRDALLNDSFSLKFHKKPLLEYDLYTKPYKWKNKHVPSVLLSGNDKKISNWRINNALSNTQKFRPDLLTTKNSD